MLCAPLFALFFALRQNVTSVLVEPHPPWLGHISTKQAAIPSEVTMPRGGTGLDHWGVFFALEMESWVNPLPTSVACQREEAGKVLQQEGAFPTLNQPRSDFWVLQTPSSMSRSLRTWVLPNSGVCQTRLSSPLKLCFQNSSPPTSQLQSVLLFGPSDLMELGTECIALLEIMGPKGWRVIEHREETVSSLRKFNLD